MKSSSLIHLEDQYGAHNYHPMPVVISAAEGVMVRDPEGKEYMDFLSAYSAVNQGHRHPKIIKALIDQAQLVTLTSRAFYNDRLGPAEKYLCDLFGYQKALMMNSGAEAVESAIKIARRWAYDKKGVPADQAVIIAATENFHGRTSTIVSFSTDPESYGGFGPRMPGFVNVPFNDIAALEAALKQNKDHVAAFLVEPIQGEAGVVIPEAGYLRKAQELCKAHHCLLVADEIQSGLGRTGKLLACHWEGVRPDMILLGKALSGGVLPVSAVMADNEVMLCIRPGQHGSTFGGNPLACAVMVAALDVLQEGQLIESSCRLGEAFLAKLEKLQASYPQIIKAVRGKGLMMAMEIDPTVTGHRAWDVCVEMMHSGLLAKPTHNHIIRLTPPLIITEEQLQKAGDIIEHTLKKMMSSNK